MADSEERQVQYSSDLEGLQTFLSPSPSLPLSILF